MTEELLNEFALTKQILREECISIVLFDSKPDFESTFTAWKKYRTEDYVSDAYGTSSDSVEEVDQYHKYKDLFDCLTLNDDISGESCEGGGRDIDKGSNESNKTPLWLCLLFESGDEIIIRRDPQNIDKKFAIMNCQFSKMPDNQPRNRLAQVRKEDGEYVIAILHK